MKLAMTLTLDGMLRALRGRVHSIAEEIEQTGRTDRGDEPARPALREPRSIEDMPR